MTTAPETWRGFDAGAIYFSCSKTTNVLNTKDSCQVILQGNLFEGNSAANKGGALRYIHTNFTTVYQDTNGENRILAADPRGL